MSFDPSLSESRRASYIEPLLFEVMELVSRALQNLAVDVGL